MAAKEKNKTSISAIVRSQYFIPVLAIVVLLIFDLISNPAFFSIDFKGQTLSGNLITVFSHGAQYVILTVGMTFVTAASGGQDISVGAIMTIAAGVIFRFILSVSDGKDVSMGYILLAFLLAILVAMLCGAFNGILVSIFKIQPMVATLVLYTAGRQITQMINKGSNISIQDKTFKYFGQNIPNCPIPTPIIVTVVFLILIALLMKFTTIGLNIQSVGINEDAAKLNGMNPVFIKFITFVILGACSAIAAILYVTQTGTLSYATCGKDYEMDTILAVALGGNALSGGKFSIGAAVLGAYAYQLLLTSLNGWSFVESDGFKAYKAIIVIVLVVCSSTTVREKFGKLVKKIKKSGKMEVA